MKILKTGMLGQSRRQSGSHTLAFASAIRGKGNAGLVHSADVDPETDAEQNNSYYHSRRAKSRNRGPSRAIFTS